MEESQRFKINGDDDLYVFSLKSSKISRYQFNFSDDEQASEFLQSVGFSEMVLAIRGQFQLYYRT